jgi:hypothetical protein
MELQEKLLEVIRRSKLNRSFSKLDFQDIRISKVRVDEKVKID